MPPVDRRSVWNSQHGLPRKAARQILRSSMSRRESRCGRREMHVALSLMMTESTHRDGSLKSRANVARQSSVSKLSHNSLPHHISVYAMLSSARNAGDHRAAGDRSPLAKPLDRRFVCIALFCCNCSSVSSPQEILQAIPRCHRKRNHIRVQPS